MIISVVATKIWYLKNVQFLLGHPVYIIAADIPGWGFVILSIHSHNISW